MPCLGFMSGIFLQQYWPSPPGTIPWMLLSLTTVAILKADWIFKKPSLKLSLQAFLMVLLFANLGFIRSQFEYKVDFPFDTHTSRLQIRGLVIHVAKTGDQVKSIMVMDTVAIAGKKYLYREKAIIYFADTAASIQPFSRVSMDYQAFRSKPANPYSFDMEAYKTERAIASIGYGNNIKILEQKATHIPVKYHPLWWRHLLTSRLDSMVKDSRGSGLIKAMLLGQREELDKETVQVFSNTGAIHVLAVSGLHVGIIATLIYWLLSFFRIKKWLMPVTAIVTLLFALITGASPSVIRASILISLFLFGKRQKLYTNGYNLLAFVALIMLLIKPTDLYSISFQFSFTAILALLMFGQDFAKVFRTKNRVINWAWGILASSVAVQLLMTPLILYYFSRFPTYFFLSGFIAIPMAFLAVAGGILGLVVSIISGDFGSFILNGLADVLNALYTCLEIMDRWPAAVMDNICLSFSGMVGLLAVVFCLYAYIKQGSRWYLYGACLSLIFMIFDEFSHFAQVNKKNEIIAYDLRNGFLIDVFQGNAFHSIQSNSLKEEAIRFAAYKYRLVRKSHQMSKEKVDAESPTKCRNFKDIRFCVVSASNGPNEKADIYFITKKGILEIPPDQKAMIVFLNGVSMAKKKAIRGKYRNARFYDMEEDGFFRVEVE